MKLLLVSVGEYSDYRVVAVYAAAKAVDAAKVAALVGGTVEDEKSDTRGSTTFPLLLNQFPAGNYPKLAKAFYTVIVERSGKAEVEAGPLLKADGTVWEPSYSLDSYSRRVAEKRPTVSIRKSHWRLRVELYADSEETAIAIARDLKEQVFKKLKPPEGTL